jgi:ferredoxin
VVDTEEGRRARVTGVKCKGCGTCGSSCIKKAIKMHHFTDEQLIAQERAVLTAERISTYCIMNDRNDKLKQTKVI